MLIHKAYKFKLNPTLEQISMLKQHGGNVRFVWNHLLDFSFSYFKEHQKYPNQSELQKQIIVLKRENEFLKIAHSQPIQVCAQRMIQTFIKALKPENIKERNKKIK